MPMRPNYIDIDAFKVVCQLAEVSVNQLTKFTREPTTAAKFRGSSAAGEEWSVLALQSVRSIIHAKQENLQKAEALLDRIERAATTNGELLRPVPKKIGRPLTRGLLLPSDIGDEDYDTAGIE